MELLSSKKILKILNGFLLNENNPSVNGISQWFSGKMWS